MKKLALFTALALAGAANAGTISYSDSFGPQTTNWNQDLSLSQFNPTLGTLTSVQFNYGGQFITNFRLENTDSQPATVSANSAGNLVFGTPITATLPVSGSTTVNLGAFDGTIDFGGSSGGVFGPFTAANNGTVTFTTGLGSYLGTGSYLINVDALGTSSATGAGNLVSIINTTAAANIQVIYTYDAPPPPSVPEPASLSLMGIGLAGLAASRRKSANKAA